MTRGDGITEDVEQTVRTSGTVGRQNTSRGRTKCWAVVLFWHVFPIITALLLLTLLIASSDLTLAQLKAMLNALSTLHIAAFIAISFVTLGLSAIKWRLVMAHLRASPTPVPSLSASVFYTCIGAVLGLVLMPHAAKPAGRALGARLYGAQPVGKSVAASIFEQVFDFIMIVLFAAFGVVLLVPRTAPVLAVALLICFAAIVFLLNRPQLLTKRLHIEDLTRLLRSPVAPRLATISLVLYLLNALRAGVIAVPAGLALMPADFFASFSLVQVSRLIAVTPMGLGIADWTWAGVLALFEVPLTVTAGFVLLNRSLNVLSTLAALALSIPLAVIDGRRAS